MSIVKIGDKKVRIGGEGYKPTEAEVREIGIKIGAINQSDIQKSKSSEPIETDRLKQPIPVRQNPFIEGAEAMTSAYASPLNLSGIGQRGIAGLQVLGAPYLAAESILARRAMSGQEGVGRLLSPSQTLEDVKQGLIGPRATLGDVNYRAGMSRPTADIVGGAQSLTLQAPELIQSGVDLAKGGIKLVSGVKGSLNKLLSRNSGLSSSKSVPRIERAESVFSKRAADIEGRAGKVIDSEFLKLKNEKDAITDQINNTKNLTTQAKNEEIAKVELDYGKKLIETENKIASTKKAIPLSAQKDAEKIRKEIQPWMSNNSIRWNKEIDNALGGSDVDIFVNKQSLTDELSQLLKSRGVDVVIDAGDINISSVNNALSVGEKKILELISRVDSSSKAVSARQLLKDINDIGSSVKYGKVFSKDQSLLDDAKSILAGQAEDIIPRLKDIRSWYGEYAQLRNRAFKSLDPFGGKYSTKATSFMEKLAKGNAKPEDFQFLDDLEKSVGKQAGRDSFALTREQNLLEDLKDALPNMKKAEIENIQKSLDKEMSRLSDQLTKESVKAENITAGNVDRIKKLAESGTRKYTGPDGLANKARIKLAKLKRISSVVKWSIGLTAAGGSAVAGVNAINK